MDKPNKENKVTKQYKLDEIKYKNKIIEQKRQKGRYEVQLTKKSSLTNTEDSHMPCSRSVRVVERIDYIY